ncbi:MAG: hypothetical protein M1822_006706 [Bathelium mastoideum]|nr:MAG: hypothetical protein M1822_006706 [Bathelium mastoideum]
MASAKKISKSTDLDDRNSYEGMGSNLSPEDENVSPLDKKLRKLTLDAVSYRTESQPSAKDRPCEPMEEHYSDNDSFNFRRGDIFRIWHPANTDVHLATFLVIGIKGTKIICLRIVQRDPSDVDYEFEREHERLRAVKWTLGASRRTANKNPDESLVIMKDSQKLKEDCWIDLPNSEYIDWRKGYKFARCGSLEGDSLNKVKKEHLRLYEEQIG